MGSFSQNLWTSFFFGAEQSNLCVCAPGEESQSFGGSHSLTLMAYVSAINFMLQFRVFVFVGANVCVELRMISSAEDLKFFSCSWSLDISTFHPVVALLSANCIFRLSSITSKHVTRFTKCHGNTFFYCSPNYNNIQVIVCRKTDDQNALCYYLRHPAPEDGKRSNYCEQNQAKPRWPSLYAHRLCW